MADQRTRAMTRRWADRAVRHYAAFALERAGFLRSADAFVALPEITDDASVGLARRAVDEALLAVLGGRANARSAERALVAMFAARQALFAALSPSPTPRNLRDAVQAVHVTAGMAY